MQLRYKLELRYQLDLFRYSLDSVKILLRLGVQGGGKIIPRIRLTSAKVVVEVEAELGNTKQPKTALLNTSSTTPGWYRTCFNGMLDLSPITPRRQL